MSNTTMWGPREDEDYLGNAAKIAIFDEPHHWDPKTDPHPNITLANKFMDFGTKYFNSDSTGGTGFAAIPDTYNTGKETTQNRGYTAASQQANNQGLLANVTSPATQPTVSVSYTAPVTPKVTPIQQTTTSNTWPKTDSALIRSLDSIAQAKINEGSATPEFLKATTQGYLQGGRHDVVPAKEKTESTATADFLRETGQVAGNAMMNSGSDKAAHDSETNFNLHFSQDPVGYANQVNKAYDAAGTAAITTDTDNDRRNIDKNAKNVELAYQKKKASAGQYTSKLALGLNAVLTRTEDKIPTAVEVAHELLRNQRDWEDVNSQMMTPRDIRTDTAEHYASDMEDYLSQTLIGEHFVNLAKVRAYRGAPFMMSNAVDMFDKSFDVWANNIIEKGDHSYLNALRDTIIQDHPTTDDVLVNLIARFMGGVNGDAVMFFWESLKDTDKREMMKQVRERQKQKLGITGEPEK